MLTVGSPGLLARQSINDCPEVSVGEELQAKAVMMAALSLGSG